MSKNLKPSILLLGLNDIFDPKAKQMVQSWPFSFINEMEIKLYEHLKKEVVGVLILSRDLYYGKEEFDIIYDLPNLKAVSCKSSGIDHLDLDTLKKSNVTVKNCPGATADSTSDVGMLLILNMARKIRKAIQALHTPSIYHDAVNEYYGTDVKGKVVGIVGLGTIGQRLAFKASLAFGMKIVYHQRNKRSDCTFPYYESLNEMLATVDFLVLSCPLNATTKHMIDLAKMKLMKPTSFLINIARGQIVETNDLVKALRCGFIAGAGLDVTDPEPLPSAHPLLQMNNVMVLPHIGTFTAEAEYGMILSSLDNLKEALGET